MERAAFASSEFAARRARVFDRIGPSACALIQGGGPVGGFEVFRQTNEFFYLTGVDIPQAYLWMDGRRRTTALFLSAQTGHDASEGSVSGDSDANALKHRYGVDEVAAIECLTECLTDVGVVYTPHNPAEGRLACQDTLRPAIRAVAADPWDALPTREQRLIGQIHARQPNAQVEDLSPILDSLRLIKSPREVAVMRRAGSLCARAVTEAIRATSPGVFEYHLGAVADYVYRANGVRSEGYRAIIASGENIRYAHYYRNDCPLQDDDLVLMDYAPDVDHYTSDIGRMWPVNGRYSPSQRELYGFIVRYHQTLLGCIRPGVMPRQVLAEAATVMRPVIETTRFSKPIYEQAARRTLDFQGHLSHPVGMAVHDVGRYFDQPLAPGLVFALDPQMWVPEEGLYIRVEDTVAVTETGVEALTGDCPIALDDMEALMSEPGLLQQFPMALAERSDYKEQV
jgi:Xaa-Pro aminopeptidase